METIEVIETYVDAIHHGALDKLEPLLAPDVVLIAPPHQARFPGNVLEYLRAERSAFPDLSLRIETSFVDVEKPRGVTLAQWTGRHMTSRICIVFEFSDGKISEIRIFGGLARVMYDVGSIQIAS